jgi:acetylornithine deacetylase/succinyl-diaminopimelate desuccinylase-like protein
MTLDWAYDRVDAKGKRFGDELERIGWKGEEKVGDRKMHAFFELAHRTGPDPGGRGQGYRRRHPRAGPALDRMHVTGKESHTGSTPMHMRKNAGRGLALITELVHEIAMKNQPNAVGAIGHIDVYPNSRNIIPGKVVFTVDMRTHLLDKLNGMVDEFMARAPGLCEEIGVSSKPRSWGSSTRPPLTRTASAPSAKPLKGLDIPTWISSRARAMMPAGSTMSRRRPWSCAPAWMGFRTTKPRKFLRHGRQRGPMCYSTPWWKLRRSWNDPNEST